MQTDGLPFERLESFRQTVRDRLSTRFGTPTGGGGDDAGEGDESPFDAIDEARRAVRVLHEEGLVGVTWPKALGGQDLTAEYQQVVNEEVGRYGLRTEPFTITFGMCGPTLLQFGTDTQRSRYIPKMLRGEEVWCQLFSEPGAGSDVASLATSAFRDGDNWVVNGQKVWTSGAHFSDFGLLIARTDPAAPKHRGISMFVVEMRSPGVTVRPLRQISGGSNFNEVFFDDVRVPGDNLVGEVNGGWRAAVGTLMNERVSLGAGGVGRSVRGRQFLALRDLAVQEGSIDKPVVRQRLIDIYVRERIQEMLGLRIRAALQAGRPPGPEGSVGKLAGSELARRVAALGAALAGPAAQAWDPGREHAGRWAKIVVQSPAASIAGGTDEIQRNIIGERVLGLPREPQVDRNIPFRQLAVGTQAR